ncbi:Protein of unknown function [Gryllus bimaculatus]|nr:Protein of unknown function [Gryllus bimaculatus]
MVYKPDESNPVKPGLRLLSGTDQRPNFPAALTDELALNEDPKEGSHDNPRSLGRREPFVGHWVPPNPREGAFPTRDRSSKRQIYIPNEPRRTCGSESELPNAVAECFYEVVRLEVLTISTFSFCSSQQFKMSWIVMP